MMKFDVTNRFTNSVQFTAEIDCAEDAPTSFKLGLAVKWAVKARANLADAYLTHANLAGATLAGANLADAYLADAYLTRANLADANLAGANLAGATLAGANLANANLACAYLAGANLANANLTRANLADATLAGAYLADATLAGAYLAGATLAGVNLAGAYLAGAEWSGGITINKNPIQLYGLTYPVTILDQHMQIGCELHSLADWAAFADERIARMDGTTAVRFWRDHRDALLALARSTERSFDPVTATEAAT